MQRHCDFCKRTHGNFHADFEFVTDAARKLIIINDMNKGNRSVTNDIDYVLWVINENYADLANLSARGTGFATPCFIKWFDVICKDSTGHYDGVALDKSGKFSHFYVIQEKDIKSAIIKIKRFNP